MDGMNQFFQFLSFAINHWPDFLAAIAAVMLAVSALLHALVVLAQMIPGSQPEKFLQELSDRFQTYVDSVEKHSRKSAAAEKKA